MPEQNDSISIAISASVDEDAAKRMIRANKELMDRYGTRYVVDAKFPPHMTLLLSGIARSAVPDLIQLVQEKAKTQKCIKTSAIRIDLDATGFLRAECSANDELIELHRALVEAFTAIYERDPRVRQSDFSRWTELTFKNGQVISDAFRPHLSIGWVDSETAWSRIRLRSPC